VKATIAVVVAVLLPMTASADGAAWVRLSALIAVRPVTDGIVMSKDGHHLARFSTWVRLTPAPGGGYSVLLMEFNCLSAPRSYRYVQETAYSAKGEALLSRSNPAWAVIVRGSMVESLSQPCDGTLGAVR